MEPDSLEMELQNQKMPRKDLEIKHWVEKVLEVIPNPSKLYSEGNKETKQSILAEKLEFEENAFRTPN